MLGQHSKHPASFVLFNCLSAKCKVLLSVELKMQPKALKLVHAFKLQ